MATLKPHVWSNAAYGVVGAGLLWLGYPAAGLALLVLCVCSWIGHAKGGNWWALDWAGMVAAFCGIIIEQQEWYHTTEDAILFANFAILASACTAGIWQSKFAPVVIGVLFGVAVWGASSPYIALGIFALAFYARQLAPKMTDRGYELYHSLWHLLTAVGFAELVLA